MVRDSFTVPVRHNVLMIIDSDQMKTFFQKVVDNMLGLVQQQLQAVQKEGAPEVKVGKLD
jgi:hypothetical protein